MKQKIKTIILLSGFQFYLSGGYSQYLYPEKYEGCQVTTFCLDCEGSLAHYPIAIINELIMGFGDSLLYKLKGTIEVQILIDEKGKPCLLSSLNRTNISSEKLNLQKVINNTSHWRPAIEHGRPTSSSVSMILEFDKRSLWIKRKVLDFTNQSGKKSKKKKNKPDN